MTTELGFNCQQEQYSVLLHTVRAGYGAGVKRAEREAYLTAT